MTIPHKMTVLMALTLAAACAPGTRRSGGGGGAGGGQQGDVEPGQGDDQGGEDEIKLPGDEGEGEAEGEGQGEFVGAEEPGEEGEAEGGEAEGEQGEQGGADEGGEGEGGEAEGEEGGAGEEGPGGEGGDDCIDVDGDGYGLGDDCLGRDCDDGNRDAHPGAEEICDNGFDDDCDLRFDAADDDCEADCVDGDQDRYGQGPGCEGPDCDDFDPLINPGIRERCGDNIDNDCDGLRDEADECGAGGDGAGCWNHLQCLIACEGDRGCTADCDQVASEDAQELFLDYAECLEDNCPQGSANNCAFDECSLEIRACLHDADDPLDCGELDLCLRTCGQNDRACGDDCERISEQGAWASLQAIYVCFDQNCDREALPEEQQDCFERRCARENEACYGSPPE